MRQTARSWKDGVTTERRGYHKIEGATLVDLLDEADRLGDNALRIAGPVAMVWSGLGEYWECTHSAQEGR